MAQTYVHRRDGVTFSPVPVAPNSGSHNAQRYRQADGQTDDMMMPVADHTCM